MSWSATSNLSSEITVRIILAFLLIRCVGGAWYGSFVGECATDCALRSLTKSSTLDVAAVLDPTLNIVKMNWIGTVRSMHKK